MDSSLLPPPPSSSSSCSSERALFYYHKAQEATADVEHWLVDASSSAGASQRQPNEEDAFLSLIRSSTAASIRHWWLGKCLQRLPLTPSAAASSPPPLDENEVWTEFHECEAASSQTSLSPRVYKMVVFEAEALREETKPWDPARFVDVDTGLLRWEHFQQRELVGVENIGLPESERFLLAAHSLVRVAFVLHHRWLMEQVPPTRFEELYQPQFSMFGKCLWRETILEVYELHYGASGPSLLAFTMLSSFLERILGDVFVSKVGSTENKEAGECPKKMNELLVHPYLVEVLGEDLIFLLRTTVGPLEGLNLRNLTWHGFFTQHEFSSIYTSLMLMIVLSLKPIIESSLLSCGRKTFITRPLLRFDHASFPSVSTPLHLFQDSKDVLQVRKLIDTTFFLLPKHRSLWHESLQLYVEGRHHRSLLLLLPQLEHMLRRAFVVTNGCAERMLTAETEVLYTTLDLILSPTLEPEGRGDGKSLLFEELGNSMANLLLDIFIWNESHRIRDQLAHGVAILDSIPLAFCEVVMAASMALCLQYDPDFRSDEYINTRCATLQKSWKLVQDYRPCFHPKAFLYSSISSSFGKWTRLRRKVQQLQQYAFVEESTALREQTFAPLLDVLQELCCKLQNKLCERFGDVASFPHSSVDALLAAATTEPKKKEAEMEDDEKRDVEDDGVKEDDEENEKDEDETVKEEKKGEDDKKAKVEQKKKEEAETEEKETTADIQHRAHFISAYCPAKEFAKIEVLRGLTDNTSSFVAELLDSYEKLEAMVKARTAWKRHRKLFAFLQAALPHFVLASYLFFLLIDGGLQTPQLGTDALVLFFNCCGALAAATKKNQFRRAVDVLTAFVGVQLPQLGSTLSTKEKAKLFFDLPSHIENL